MQIGTANFVEPAVHERVLEGLVAHLERHGLSDIRELVGTLEYPGEAKGCETGGGS